MFDISWSVAIYQIYNFHLQLHVKPPQAISELDELKKSRKVHLRIAIYGFWPKVKSIFNILSTVLRNLEPTNKSSTSSTWSAAVNPEIFTLISITYIK